MTYQIARSIRAFEAARWEIPNAGIQLAMSYRWQLMMEDGWRNYKPRYILIEDAHGPAATVIANTTATFSRTGWREQVLRRISLVVSAPYTSIHCGIAIRPDADQEATMAEIERALAEVCSQNQRAILAVGNVSSADVASWRERGYFTSRQPTFSMLDLPGASYEDYLRRLPGKDRAEIRRIRRKADEFGVTFQHGPLRDEGPAIYPLLCQVFARHGTSPDTMPFNADLFSVWRNVMPDEIWLFKAFVKGKLEAVLVCIRGEGVLWWPMAGLNYAVSRPTYLYFLLMDEMIRWSIANGIKRIYGGLTNEREKQGHGFYQVERWFCFRAHPRPLNRAFQRALPHLLRIIGGTNLPPPSDPLPDGTPPVKLAPAETAH